MSNEWYIDWPHLISISLAIIAIIFQILLIIRMAAWSGLFRPIPQPFVSQNQRHIAQQQEILSTTGKKFALGLLSESRYIVIQNKITFLIKISLEMVISIKNM